MAMGVRKASTRRHALGEFRGHVLEIFEADREDHAFGDDDAVIFIAGVKARRRRRIIEAADLPGKRLDAFLLNEPVDVAQIKFERKRLGLRDAETLGFQKALNCVDACRIEVPVAARAKVHAVWHVRGPELHGSADQSKV